MHVSRADMPRTAFYSGDFAEKPNIKVEAVMMVFLQKNVFVPKYPTGFYGRIRVVVMRLAHISPFFSK